MNIYSYVEGFDIQFYKHHKSLARKLDILDYIPGSIIEEKVHGEELPLDMARRINPKEFALRVLATF